MAGLITMSEHADPSTSPTLMLVLGLPGKEQDWRRFVSIYSPVIERYCRESGLSAQDGEEVQSRVLVALATAIRGLAYDPALSFRGYLRKCVVNAIRRMAREKDRHPDQHGSGHDANQKFLERIPAPESVASLAEEIESDVLARLKLAQQALEAVRLKVTPDVWQAYWATAIDDQKAAEVAARLGKTVGAVYMAKNRVKKLLQQEGRRLLEPPPQE